MIVFLWFSMVAFIILVGFVVIGLAIRHHWKESRNKDKIAAAAASTSSQE